MPEPAPRSAFDPHYYHFEARSARPRAARVCAEDRGGLQDLIQPNFAAVPLRDGVRTDQAQDTSTPEQPSSAQEEVGQQISRATSPVRDVGDEIRAILVAYRRRDLRSTLER